MARTKQTHRKSTGVKSCHWPACYEKNLTKAHPPSTKKRYALRKRNAKQHVATSVKSSRTFPQFAKLPEELRTKIWQAAAEDGRVVAVRSTTKNGLNAPVPPILHVCRQSRAIGLKQYTLCFSALKDTTSGETVPAEVYFNFERDTLYFGPGWNHGVDGVWSCISGFRTTIINDDLQHVKSVGFALGAIACSARSASDHIPIFAGWTGLETLYLGLEDPHLDLERAREFHELQPEDIEWFLRSYRETRGVVELWDGWYDVDAMKEIENRTIYRYMGYGRPPERLSTRLCPVRVVGL